MQLFLGLISGKKGVFDADADTDTDTDADADADSDSDTDSDTDSVSGRVFGIADDEVKRIAGMVVRVC